MRTTVTLDKDVEQLLRAAMHRSRRSFKETLNVAVRLALAGPPARAARPTRFVVRAGPMGLRAGIDPSGLNKMADDLEADAVIAASASGKRT